MATQDYRGEKLCKNKESFGIPVRRRRATVHDLSTARNSLTRIAIAKLDDRRSWDNDDDVYDDSDSSRSAEFRVRGRTRTGSHEGQSRSVYRTEDRHRSLSLDTSSTQDHESSCSGDEAQYDVLDRGVRVRGHCKSLDVDELQLLVSPNREESTNESSSYERMSDSKKGRRRSDQTEMASQSTNDLNDDDIEEERTRNDKGPRISPFMLCTLGLCYSFNLLMVSSVGLLGYFFFADINKHNTSTNGDGIGTSDCCPMPERNPWMTPSLGPSSNDINGQPTAPINGEEMPTILTHSIPDTSYSPSVSPGVQPTLSITSSSISHEPPFHFSSPTSDLLSGHLNDTSHHSSDPSSFLLPSQTSSQGCPKQLLKSVTLDTDALLTMKYDVISHHDDAIKVGGELLCISLEYAGAVGWMGLAFSSSNDATSCDPKFARKEAIIGIPGVMTSVAIAAEDGSANLHLGQQHVAVDVGPHFVNPAKYIIPPGGIGWGYSGPSLNLLFELEKQTLINGSITTLISNPYHADDDVMYTRMSFAKYFQEPGEVEINYNGTTSLMYAVAPLLGDGEYYEGNPQWKCTSLNFSDESLIGVKSEHSRKRNRHHHEVNK